VKALNTHNSSVLQIWRCKSCNGLRLAETRSSKTFTMHYCCDSLLIIFYDWNFFFLTQRDITVKDVSMFYYCDIMKCLQLIHHRYQISRHAPDMTFALYFLSTWSWTKDFFAKSLLPYSITLAPVILNRPATESCRRSCSKC